MNRTWTNPIIAVIAFVPVLAILGAAGGSMASFPDVASCIGPENYGKYKDIAQQQVTNFLSGGAGALAEQVATYKNAFAVGLGIVFGSVFLLLLAFRFLPKLATWFLCFLNVIVVGSMGVYAIARLNATALGVTLIIFAALFTFLILFKKSAVNEAAMLFKMSTFAIFANPGMIAMTFLIQLFILGFGAFMIGGIVAAAVAGDFTPGVGIGTFSVSLPSGTISCLYSRKAWGPSAYGFLAASLGYIALNFKMVRLYMISVVTAFWYWEDPNNPRPFKSCTGMKWALSYGYGVVATAAIIISIVDQIVRTASSKKNMCIHCCNPLFWVCFILVRVMRETLYALTTFAMIIGAITGEGYCVSANRSYYTLKGRFSTLFTVSGVSRSVVFGFANIISFVAYLATMNLVNQSLGYETVGSSMGLASYEILAQFLVFLVGLLAVSYPIVFIFLVLMISGVCIEYSSSGQCNTTIGSAAPGFCLGMFVGAIANYLLTYMSEVLLDVMNALFAVAEIDRKNGIVPGQGVVEGTPAYFANYYYTEMAKLETSGATVVTIQQGLPQGVVQGVVTSPPPYTAANV